MDDNADSDDVIIVEMTFPSSSSSASAASKTTKASSPPVLERWIDKQQPTEEEISWSWRGRMHSAIYDALKSQSKPIMFVVTSQFTSHIYWYVWYPPKNEALAADVLKTLILTRTSARYSKDNHRQHRKLVCALIQVLASEMDYDANSHNKNDNESYELLKYYFNRIDLGRINHLYFYDADDHFDSSVYAESLDNNLAMYNWMC